MTLSCPPPLPTKDRILLGHGSARFQASRHTHAAMTLSCPPPLPAKDRILLGQLTQYRPHVAMVTP